MQRDRHKRDILKSYRYSEKIIKNHSRSFYKAFSRLPREKARTVFAVYAFCRQADDLIDQGGDLPALEQLGRDFTAFEKGEDHEGTFWPALRDSFNRFSMEGQYFHEMIEGQFRDSRFSQPGTMKELEEYCYYVAGTVGLMLLPVIASSREEPPVEEALSLGFAMQITNILRDVGEDLRMGRIYLPADLMARFHVKREDLQAGVPTGSFIQLWEFLASTAQEHYMVVEGNPQWLDKDSRDAVILSGLIYREILNEVRKNNYNVFTKRCYVSTARKLEIIREYKKRSRDL